jgi:hypothetical protein
MATPPPRARADGTTPRPQLDHERRLEPVGQEHVLAPGAEPPGPGVDHRPLVQDDAALTKREGAIDVVSRQHKTHAAGPQAVQDVFELATRGRVEAHERLVQQQHAGAHGQHPGQRQATLLAARQRVRMARAKAVGRQADRRQGARRRRVHLGL